MEALLQSHLIPSPLQVALADHMLDIQREEVDSAVALPPEVAVSLQLGCMLALKHAKRVRSLTPLVMNAGETLEISLA